MAYKFNPTTGKLDTVADPGGSDTHVQFNDSGSFGGVSDLTYNKTTKVLTNKGDVNLDDGGSFTTTLQTITPTANRTLSLPDATGTVALVAGSSGQLLWNNAGANAGASTLTYDGSILTSSGRFINSYNATASSPAKAFTGTWFTGGTATTTKPHLLIEPTGATSTAWSTGGTGLGVNAATGFAGNLLDLQVNGTSQFFVGAVGTSSTSPAIRLQSSSVWVPFGSALAFGGSTGGPGLHVEAALGAGLNSAGLLWWTNSTSSGAYSNRDVILARDAANTLAQRNGTNAQVFRVYNTYTSSTNYELGKLEWSGNVFRIGTEKGSVGGTARNLELQTDGTTRIQISNNQPQTNFLDSAGGAFVNVNSIGNVGIRVANGYGYTFTPAAANANAPDAAFVRDAAAVVKVTDGSTGNGTLLAQHRLAGTAPATSTSTGTAGDIRYDADYIYVCTATNTWKRAALATW